MVPKRFCVSRPSKSHFSHISNVNNISHFFIFHLYMFPSTKYYSSFINVVNGVSSIQFLRANITSNNISFLSPIINRDIVKLSGYIFPTGSRTVFNNFISSVLTFTSASLTWSELCEINNHISNVNHSHFFIVIKFQPSFSK